MSVKPNVNVPRKKSFSDHDIKDNWNKKATNLEVRFLFDVLLNKI